MALLLAVELLAHGPRSRQHTETDLATAETQQATTEAEQAGVETETAAPAVVRDSEIGTDIGNESDGETAKVITLAGLSPNSQAADQPTAQEVMWEHFQREQAHGRTPTGPSWTVLPARTTTAVPCCGSGTTRAASHPQTKTSACKGAWDDCPTPRRPTRSGRHHPPTVRVSPARLVLRLPGVGRLRRQRRVPTVSDEYGDVDHARRLVSTAQDVLVRAVVYARGRGGRWDDIAEALNLTTEQVRDHYSAAIEQWEDALNRPWERSGRFLCSRMPDGTTEPDRTAADLDQWCLRHLKENHGARHNARHAGIEDQWSPPTSPNTPRSPR